MDTPTSSAGNVWREISARRASLYKIFFFFGDTFFYTSTLIFFFYGDTKLFFTSTQILRSSTETQKNFASTEIIFYRDTNLFCKLQIVFTELALLALISRDRNAPHLRGNR